MAEDNYEDGQDMTEIGFSGLSHGRKNARGRSATNHSDPGTGKKGLLFAGAALLTIVVIIAIVLLTGNGSSDKPIAAIQVRVKALEEKVARFSVMEATVSTAQQQQKALRQSVSGLQSSVKSLEGKLDNIGREVARLNKKKGTTAGRVKGTTSIKKRQTNSTHSRYHDVRRGESLYKIAKKYGISLQELYRLNNLTSKSVIHPGQKLMITPGGKK